MKILTKTPTIKQKFCRESQLQKAQRRAKQIHFYGFNLTMVVFRIQKTRLL